ncbi:hypothetical protein ERD78_01730 [Allopusillimonas soli]|uniref:DUF465 domain-containing protein n=1 Tax=Allopusillimonas soli TaxID=659016 RepID=A0A853F6J2_9BURK|nr:hypothetical protein [Allopusillimonas soli]NYT35577.1 hypothetical protein [Allopusillimonas soli]TEA75980.1 hypothetical protein ERD78_01730 [Allopusillimonas soli]
MDQWKNWLEQALQQFEELKAAEKVLYTRLQEAERINDFALSASLREQWFRMKVRTLALNNEIVEHLDKQPPH